MTFKVEKLEPNVCIIRGYRKKNDIKYCAICTLHKKENETSWQIHGFMSDKGTTQEVKKVLAYLKNFPDGVFTYVSDDDWKRFYKKYNFKRIDF